jgi:hypothetical protein
MNSQALQKKIVDGKLFSHASTGEWPCDDFRSPLGGGAEERLLMATTDVQWMEYAASEIPGHRVRNWGNG